MRSRWLPFILAVSLVPVAGVFIYVLLLIPNSAVARVAILCCGTLLAGSGALLKMIGKRLKVREAEACRVIRQAV